MAATSSSRGLVARSLRTWMRSLPSPSPSPQPAFSLVSERAAVCDDGDFKWRGNEDGSKDDAKGWNSIWSFATAGLIALCSTTPACHSNLAYSHEANAKKPKVVFVLGGPGSGKGTQCARIVDSYGFTHLSAGDLLRAEIKAGSKEGIMIQNLIKEGKIVPSEVTVKLLQKAMRESGNDKFLIDGFPRNEENRAAFEAVTGIEPEFVLFLDCSEEEMEKRLLNRNQGRIDDNVETIKKRFKVFTESSLPVVQHYEQRGKLQKINAARSVEDVFKSLQPLFVPFVKEDLLQLSKELLEAIDVKDFETYRRLCDPSLTAFEPEAQGHLVEGLQFHHLYFIADIPLKLASSEVASPKIVLVGDSSAVVTYTRLCQKVSRKGDVIVEAFNETRVWERKKESGDKAVWKSVHFHRSKTPRDS